MNTLVPWLGWWTSPISLDGTHLSLGVLHNCQTGSSWLTHACPCSHVTAASGTAWKQGRLDFTGAQMVLTLKLISIASCYQDGLRKDAVRQLRIATALHSDLSLPLLPVRVTFSPGWLIQAGWAVQDLTDYQRKMKLEKLPSLLEYLSYIFASGNLLAGNS